MKYRRELLLRILQPEGFCQKSVLATLKERGGAGAQPKGEGEKKGGKVGNILEKDTAQRSWGRVVIFVGKGRIKFLPGMTPEETQKKRVSES